MSGGLRVTLDASESIALFEKYPDRIRRGAARAINRSLNSARTVMVRAMAQETGLKSAILRTSMFVLQATADRLAGSFEAGLRRIPLIQFNARQVGVRRGGGVQYRLGGQMRTVGDAFIATMASGHKGVFARVPGGQRRGPKPNRSQLPIYELFGPSLGKVFEKFRPLGIARAQEMLEKNMNHELEFAAAGVDITEVVGVDDAD